MSVSRHSPTRSIAAHAVLITYTLIALFPVFVIVVNAFNPHFPSKALISLS